MDGATIEETITIDADIAAVTALAAPDTSPSARSEVTARPALPLGELVVSATGFVVLAVAVGLGSGDVTAVAHSMPALLGPAAGAVLLTTPGLVVAHQFLDVQGAIADVVDGVARGFHRAGQLAWGLVPFFAYLSATAPGWWSSLLGLAGLALVGTALAAAGVAVSAVAAGGKGERARWNMIVIGWIALTAAIGARLAALGW